MRESLNCFTRLAFEGRTDSETAGNLADQNGCGRIASSCPTLRGAYEVVMMARRFHLLCGSWVKALIIPSLSWRFNCTKRRKRGYQKRTKIRIRRGREARHVMKRKKVVKVTTYFHISSLICDAAKSLIKRRIIISCSFSPKVQKYTCIHNLPLKKKKKTPFIFPNPVYDDSSLLASSSNKTRTVPALQMSPSL